MPIMPCMKDGQKGMKFGEHGTCYTGPRARTRIDTGEGRICKRACRESKTV